MRYIFDVREMEKESMLSRIVAETDQDRIFPANSSSPLYSTELLNQN
jgi:hypothetical protein